MNSELKVGMPAMIIGCSKRERSHLIGTIVTVEEMWEVGEDVTGWYLGCAELGLTVTVKPQTSARVLVSGCGATGQDKRGFFSMPKGFINIDAKYLMPLPPLDDDAKLLDTETPKETEKC